MSQLNKSNQIPNKIILSQYSTTTIQRRIVYCLLMQIEKVMEYVELNQDPIFEVPKSIICNNKRSNVDLRNACIELVKKPILTRNNDDDDFEIIMPFVRVNCEKGKGGIDIELNRRACGVFYELKKGYSKIDYQSALQLQSIYAQKLYEHLCMRINGFEEGTIWTTTVEEFRFINQTVGKYKKWNDFKKFVIDTAVNAVNEHTDIKVQYELSKKGRSFHYIEFYFSKRNKESEFDKVERAVMDAEAERIIEELNKMNITDQKIQEIILRDYRKAYAKWKYQVKTKQIIIKSNYGGHLLKTLGLR